jgi:hypothetical protein
MEFLDGVLKTNTFKMKPWLGLAATYLVGKGMMEAGAAALTEGLVFMKKLGGFIAGLARHWASWW